MQMFLAVSPVRIKVEHLKLKLGPNLTFFLDLAPGFEFRFHVVRTFHSELFHDRTTLFPNKAVKTKLVPDQFP